MAGHSGRGKHLLGRPVTVSLSVSGFHQQGSAKRQRGFHLPAHRPEAQLPSEQPEPRPAQGYLPVLWAPDALQSTVSTSSSTGNTTVCTGGSTISQHALLYFQSSQKEQILNTFVVSASVTNASSPIQDLAEDVIIMLHHLTPNTVGSDSPTLIINKADCSTPLFSRQSFLLQLHRDVHCVYWNFNENSRCWLTRRFSSVLGSRSDADCLSSPRRRRRLGRSRLQEIQHHPRLHDVSVRPPHTLWSSSGAHTRPFSSTRRRGGFGRISVAAGAEILLVEVRWLVSAWCYQQMAPDAQ